METTPTTQNLQIRAGNTCCVTGAENETTTTRNVGKAGCAVVDGRNGEKQKMNTRKRNAREEEGHQTCADLDEVVRRDDCILVAPPPPSSTW
ncbi:hypothetical protein A2U01_0026867 [Trifolium medium]|uniref:Uncharacterized protein n=1 Tax=Trifolium medium TaxID=97028 RepID=A0A392P262_9FABA|nr:hypothetical protein [Trifolium medium]